MCVCVCARAPTSISTKGVMSTRHKTLATAGQWVKYWEMQSTEDVKKRDG